MRLTNFHLNNTHIQKTPVTVIDIETEAHLYLRVTFFNGRGIVMNSVSRILIVAAFLIFMLLFYFICSLNDLF